ncbi:MAG: FAD-binding protein [Gemmatimonadetes bacterium]|nr:FAD-binding protein [Gemmatimonadota bacterium]
MRRVRSMLGPDAVVDTDASGMPRVAPRAEEGVALVLQAAAAEGWRVRIEGRGSWVPADAPADLALTTRALARVTRLDAADLVATVEAGVAWGDLQRALADQGVWVAADPPGEGRSVGSVVATGTAGPLRSGFGAVREHVLGATLVTGEGRIVRAGGRVVKNVAGYDLTKLATGSFGSFGVVTSVNLRLRAVPRADLTLLGEGERDALLDAARAMLEAGITPASLEVLSPLAAGRDSWTLAVRCVGSAPAVEADAQAAGGASQIPLAPLEAVEAGRFWRRALAGATASPVTLRMGALATAMDDALDLVLHHLDEHWIMAGVGAGGLRWSGDAPADRIRLLRHAAAPREMPLTLERAPWALRAQVGYFGAYREGVGQLVGALKDAFDPAGVLVVPIADER